MRRRTFFGVGVLGVVATGTCSWWRREPATPLQLVSLEVEQSRRFVPAEVGTELWAVLRVTVDEGPHEERPPVHVGLVIDTSASMRGDAMAAARAAAIELVASLHDGDRLSVVTFDSHARLVVPNVELDDDAREECLEAIEAIEARGTTDLAAGLQLALDDLLPHAAQGRVSRIVLLGDGVPNDPSMIPSAVAQASAAGITVTTLGFGLDYDEILLASIAQQTGGTFHFLEHPDALVPLFREQTARLQGIAAKELVLTLTTGPGVELREVVGQGLALPQPRVFMGLGDLSRGEERVVVARLSVGPHRAGATVELLDARLSWRDPRTGGTLSEDVFLSAQAEDDEAVLAEAIDPEVEREVETAKAAALTLHAVALSRDGNGVDAMEILAEAAPVAQAVAERLEDPRLLEQANDMAELAASLEAEAEPEGSERWPAEVELEEADGDDLSRAGEGAAVFRAPPKSPRGERILRQAHSNAVSSLQARSKR